MAKFVMRRANGYLIFFYCCLLFSAGMVFGFIFTEGGEVGFVSFLSAASSLATVGAALTAIYALYAWYPQFKHTEKYRLIKDFQAVASNSDAIMDFINALSGRLVTEGDAGLVSGLPSRNPIPDDEGRAFWRYMDSMQYTWKNMMDVLSEDESKVFDISPDIVEKLTKGLIHELIDLSSSESDENRSWNLRCHAADGTEIIASKCKEMESGSRSLLKRLAS